MKNRINGYWVFRLIIKILIPLMFFVIANVSDAEVANALAGVTLIFTLALYVLQSQHVGDDKYVK